MGTGSHNLNEFINTGRDEKYWSGKTTISLNCVATVILNYKSEYVIPLPNACQRLPGFVTH